MNFNVKLARGRRPLVPLFVQRQFVDEPGGEHDVGRFVWLLLEEMRRVEVASGRAVEWPGVEGNCSHVDRLFACLFEERRMCSCCYRVTSRFESSTVLSLPLPADQDFTSWRTDLYTEFCRTQCVLCDDADAVCCEGECASVQEHWLQKRLVHTPNVLVFRVPRFDGSGARRRFALCLEE